MAGLTLEFFENQVSAACAASPIVTSVSMTDSGVTWLRLRAYLNDGSFVETFFNEATGRTSFALIKDNRRIFGADNTGQWHWHLFESPDEHTPTNEVISFDEFIQRIEIRFSQK
jgi:hypothetical protein